MRRRRRISMNTEVQTKERDAMLVEDAGWIRVMGQPVLEALPSARAPYAQVDPFIIVHEARGRLSPDFANTATKHLHRGFDNVLYMLQGSLSTGHSTGPGGAMERARLREGSPARLGTPALVRDIELPRGGEATTSVPPQFQGFAYVLEGEAAFGANRRRAKPAQLVVLGPGEAVTVRDATPRTRYLLMAGPPYGGAPPFNGPFVDYGGGRGP